MVTLQNTGPGPPVLLLLTAEVEGRANNGPASVVASMSDGEGLRRPRAKPASHLVVVVALAAGFSVAACTAIPCPRRLMPEALVKGQLIRVAACPRDHASDPRYSATAPAVRLWPGLLACVGCSYAPGRAGLLVCVTHML